MSENLFDSQAELYLLGAAITDAYALYEVTSVLKPVDFGNEEHNAIYTAIENLHQRFKACSIQTLSKELESRYSASNTFHRLVEIAYLSTTQASNVDVVYYIEHVKKLSIKRQLINYTSLIQKKLNDQNTDVLNLRDDLISRLSDLTLDKAEEFILSHEALANFKNDMPFLEYIEWQRRQREQGIDTFDGYRTGYPRLDHLIGGFSRGTNNIIGARSGTGKTTILINLVINLHSAYPDIKTGFFSLEMPNYRITEKLVQTYCQIHPNKFVEGTFEEEEYERLKIAVENINKWQFNLYKVNLVNVDTLRTAIKKKITRDGLDIVFIDYLSLIRTKERYANKHLEIDAVSKTLYAISKEFNIPVVTLAQLNREAAHRERPSMTDLRESGSIEEDSDLILLLNRPGLKDANSTDCTEVIVEKNRLYGDRGIVKYDYRMGRLIEHKPLEELLDDTFSSGD